MPFYKANCPGCGLELTTTLTLDEVLAQAQLLNPDIKEIDFYCKLCLDLIHAADPNVLIFGRE